MFLICKTKLHLFFFVQTIQSIEIIINRADIAWNIILNNMLFILQLLEIIMWNNYFRQLFEILKYFLCYINN